MTNLQHSTSADRVTSVLLVLTVFLPLPFFQASLVRTNRVPCRIFEEFCENPLQKILSDLQVFDMISPLLNESEIFENTPSSLRVASESYGGLRIWPAVACINLGGFDLLNLIVARGNFSSPRSTKMIPSNPSTDKGSQVSKMTCHFTDFQKRNFTFNDPSDVLSHVCQIIVLFSSLASCFHGDLGMWQSMLWLQSRCSQQSSNKVGSPQQFFALRKNPGPLQPPSQNYHAE